MVNERVRKWRIEMIESSNGGARDGKSKTPTPNKSNSGGVYHPTIPAREREEPEAL